MISPYKKRLEELRGSPESSARDEIVIHRANAGNVKGRIEVVDDYGVTIIHPDPGNDEGLRRLFVAFEDIRGVESGDWDYSIIAT